MKDALKVLSQPPAVDLRLLLKARTFIEQIEEDAMSTAEKFIILPYRKNRGNLVPGEMRQASSVPSAEKIAASMTSRFIGVAAYTVMVDEETGDMLNRTGFAGGSNF
jgi:hypothetical protein